MSRTFDYPGLRILDAFFDDLHEVYLREIADKVGVSPITAKRNDWDVVRTLGYPSDYLERMEP